MAGQTAPREFHAGNRWTFILRAGNACV